MSEVPLYLIRMVHVEWRHCLTDLPHSGPRRTVHLVLSYQREISHICLGMMANFPVQEHLRGDYKEFPSTRTFK